MANYHNVSLATTVHNITACTYSYIAMHLLQLQQKVFNTCNYAKLDNQYNYSVHIYVALTECNNGMKFHVDKLLLCTLSPPTTYHNNNYACQ